MIQKFSHSDTIQKLKKARRFIEDHYSESLGLREIAKSSHLSQFHFHRMFKAYFQITCIDYLVRVRLEKSIQLLSYSRQSIADISFEVGFPNPETYIRNFRKSFGITPNVYRKNFKSYAKPKYLFTDYNTFNHSKKIPNPFSSIKAMDSFPIAILRTEGKQNILRKTLHRLLDKIIPLGIFMQDTPFFGRSLDPPILSDPRLQIWELGVKITKPSIRNLPYPLETVSWKKWRSDLSKIEILSVDPEIWKETATNDYTTTFKTVNISEKSKWVMQVIDPPFINARWTGKFIEKDKGTTIIFEESIEIDSLPYRILTFLFLDLEKLMMTYLKDLTYSLKETWDEKRVKTTLE